MAPTITVAQHVFASLTREQSPNRRRGYQTLFYTHGRLTADDVRAIEDRTQYPANQGEKDKWQYFWLSGRLAVVSHLTAVPEPDEFGRKGRYLAHSLIVSAADWHLLNNTPFALMKTQNFCQTMDQMLALGDLKTGELGPLTPDIRRAQPEAPWQLANQWAPDELWKLARLTCHAYGITERREFVAFIGKEGQIREALDVAFMFPPAPRSGCSFDTSAQGCVWPRDVAFWAQGFENEREARTPFVVDAAQKRVRLPPDWHPPNTPYENWLKFIVSTRQFPSLQKNERDALLLSQLLEGRSSVPDEMRGITVSFKTEFGAANQVLVAERIAKLFPELPDYLCDSVLSRIGRTSPERFEWLIKNPTGAASGDILFDIFGEWKETPTPDLMRSMAPLAARHTGMRLLFAFWARDEKEVQRTLTLMSEEQYRQSVAKLRRRSPDEPWQFFSAKHLRDWFTIFARRFDLNDLALGISMVAKHGSQQELDELSLIANQIDSNDERKALLDWLKEQSFHRRVKYLRSALEQSFSKQSESGSDSSPRRGWIARRFQG
jgi:hypothetical protein